MKTDRAGSVKRFSGAVIGGGGNKSFAVPAWGWGAGFDHPMATVRGFSRDATERVWRAGNGLDCNRSGSNGLGCVIKAGLPPAAVCVGAGEIAIASEAAEWGTSSGGKYLTTDGGSGGGTG